ncbi:NYN domain-containing protein [Ralstonia pseudosolanacearum]|uniref:NYN domain-containing protein n=1 Tax=Ralstonia pseudosolanacearum TaxID=1310165 RepID=A0A6F8PJG3_9RALS|nr:NYN domain-containing protein [Ralstonia pseudosolanacearum]BCL85510.1 hypothetical protein MAFF211471_05930 [Ralstonia solanacearum]BCM98057.1 hypothetical protein RPSA_05940 [Ralstonia solanacearum]
MADAKVHLFVDNSNVKIEATRLAYAKRHNAGVRCELMDHAYEIDWGKFIHLVKSKGNRQLSQIPTLYGSRPPPDDSVWQEIKKEGFDVVLFDRNIRNKEKGVDNELGMDVAERTLLVKPPETIVIAAGDEDFLGGVRRAVSRGWNVEVWFWGNANRKLQEEGGITFVNMDKFCDYLRKGGGVALPPAF